MSIATTVVEPEALFESGRFQDALAAWQAVADRQPDAVRPRARIAACLLALGRNDEALAILEPLAAAAPDQPLLLVRLAAAHAATDDPDRALDALDRAAAAGARLAMGIDTDPAFDRLRRRPRFAAVRARIEANDHPTADDPAFRAFDFWVGTWEARTEDGVRQGTNRIERVLGGAAIVERWSGATGYRGMSLNRFDRHAGTWRQTWVDDQGDVVEFEDGAVRDGRMVFVAQDRAGTIRRLSFEPGGPDAFRQVSEQSTDGGATWSLEYDFRYRRLPEGQPDA